MSQAIKKLQEGGKTSQSQDIKMFKIGDNQIPVSTVLDNLNRNWNTYTQTKTWNKRKREAAQTAFNQITDAILNGNIAERNLNREYIDSSGKITNSQSKFDPYGEVAGFANDILDTLQTSTPKTKIDEQETQKKSIKDFSIDSFLVNKLFGGNESPDWSAWTSIDKNTRRNNVATTLQDYISKLNSEDYDYSDSPYSDKNEYISKINAAINGLQNTKNVAYNAVLLPLGLNEA